jgi:hypothetical protein
MSFKILPCSIFLIHLSIISSLSAQESIPEGRSNSNSLSLGFGASNFHLLDKHATFLIFRGTGISPSIGYTHNSIRSEHSVNGEFYYDNLKSSSDNYKTEIYGGQFRYSYLRKLRHENSLGSTGISVTSYYNKANYKFDMQNILAHAIESWYWCHSIDLAIKLEKDLGKNKVEMKLFIPLVSNVSRPEYSSSGNYDYEKNDWVTRPFGKTVFLTKSPGIDTRLKYSHGISDKIRLNAEYEFRYAQYKSPELIRFYMNNVRLGLSFSFNNYQDEN